ncbi:MAG: PrgI family protein [Patescibacteria group bacterium]|jgi:hypothetical protein
MEQHPIPQQISSYEFKLVGEMTLKQFFKAAIGLIAALLVNATGVVFFIKWPLMILFGGGGLLLAFVPYEDRPLETWLMAFIKSVYAPTIYIYRKKTAIKPATTEPEQKKEEKVKPEEEDGEVIVKKDKKKVGEFIMSLPSVKREKKETESEEEPVKAKMIELKEDKKKSAGKTEKTKEEAVKSNNEEWRDQKSNLNLQRRKLEATGEASFGEIPMPDIPEIPNVLVGMATDIEGKIAEGAIVEIQDDLGNPSRVLKTNSLGQFKTSTPLANGRYLIITEKEGHNFDRVNVELKGEIVQPIKIISK